LGRSKVSTFFLIPHTSYLTPKNVNRILIIMQLKITHRRKGGATDEDLLKEFTKTGDLDALGELYAEYMHLVYGVCIKYLKNRDESMDAVMQIFEKLIIEIPKQKIENFRSWLHVVTKNYCLMQLRSQKSHDEKLNEWLADPTVFMESGSILHPIDDNEAEMDKALADCIEKLKSEQKNCINQFYYENMCYGEIAVNLGLDEKKVKSHLQNAKRNLKLCLEEKNVGQEFK
jgi:RNA polymerase sigma-70 factor, ECF subfamily